MTAGIVSPAVDRGHRRRLLAAIHDVSPRFERQIDELAALIGPACDGRMAMLVVPDFWGEAPILPGSRFAARLRQWADSGIEMFLHGYYHRDHSAHASALDRWRARHMTAGEGEFLGLEETEAVRRIQAGRRLLEDVTGKSIAGFVAPAWLYGHGAHEALGACDIPLAENHWRVWSPSTGRTLSRSPVITWASRSWDRRQSSLAVAAAARSLPLPPTVRLAVHPGDCGHVSLRRSIERTLAKLIRTHRPTRYAELLA